MLSEKEFAFIQYWPTVRDSHNKFSSKLVRGLPIAIMFCLPIVLFIMAVYIFLPVWFTKISNTSEGSFITVLIAVFIAIIFFSYFRMHFKWEMNEQLYKELLYKQKKVEAADSSEKLS